MIAESPAESRRSRDRPAGAHSRKTRQGVRVRSVAVPRPRVGGDTDALDWRSDPRLLAILARSVKREREARDKDEFRRDELDQAGPAGAGPELAPTFAGSRARR